MALTIDKNSLLFRVAYFLADKELLAKKTHVSLCVLFWRAVLLTPLQVSGFIVIVAFFIGWLLFGLLFMDVAQVLAYSIEIVALLAFSITAIFRDIKRLPETPNLNKAITAVSLLAEVIAAKKARVCPRLRIVDGKATS